MYYIHHTIVIKHNIIIILLWAFTATKSSSSRVGVAATTGSDIKTLTTATIIIIRHTGSFVHALRRAQHNILV